MPVACVFGPRNTTEAVKTHPIRRVRFSFQGARAAPIGAAPAILGTKPKPGGSIEPPRMTGSTPTGTRSGWGQ